MKQGQRKITPEEKEKIDAAIDKQKKSHMENQQSMLEDARFITEPIMHHVKSEPIKWNVPIRIRTQFNAHMFEHPGEVNNLPSLTVPDQTMSIKEILERHARGLGITDGKVPLYSGGSDYLDGIDPRTLDIAEKFEILEAVQERYDQRRADLEKQTQELKKKEMEDMIKQEVENRLKQKQLPGENSPA